MVFPIGIPYWYFLLVFPTGIPYWLSHRGECVHFGKKRLSQTYKKGGVHKNKQAFATNDSLEAHELLMTCTPYRISSKSILPEVAYPPAPSHDPWPEGSLSAGGVGSPKTLYKAPTDSTKTRQTIQSPEKTIQRHANIRQNPKYQS